MQDWLNKLDKFFTKIFLNKLPQLSKNARAWIVKGLPWLILAFALLAIPGIIAGLGIGALATPFWLLGGRNYIGRMLIFFLNLVVIVLEIIAIPLLFKRVKKGWQLLFQATLLGLAGNILGFSIIGLIITGITLYFLYQIKSAYK